MFGFIDDISLLEKLQAGDVQAFEYFYTRYRTELIVYAYSILEDEAEAKDVVQEFFISFWEKKLYLTLHNSIKSFLYVSIKNRCLNKLRDNDTRRQRHQEITLPEDYTLPSTVMEHQEFQQEVSRAIEKEAPLSSKVFQLAYFEQHSYKEIAQIMGISPNTVKNQLIRALKIVKGKFSKKLSGNSPLSA